ncbi:MAG: hypothetical protein HKO53_05765 [Gemmatimonadetes bacterium]|nr:hypothetical protein [Gemmatimonadota bacterium]NNM32549.1 hypothetical protein [Gemmatimonadota bacterium]
MSPDAVAEVIRARRTIKFRVDPDRALPPGDDSTRSLVEELVDLGATAPHHFPCHSGHQQGPLDSPAPWRFHCMTGPACRRLMAYVLTLDGLVDKLAALLAAADGLILVTWLPDPPSSPLPADSLFEPTRRNMEHVAGVAAAVQNMLLAATAKGVETYWGSGGVFRRPAVARRLGIGAHEVLLGAVFLFPTPDDAKGEVKPGARRRSAGPRDSWMRWVEAFEAPGTGGPALESDGTSPTLADS